MKEYERIRKLLDKMGWVQTSASYRLEEIDYRDNE